MSYIFTRAGLRDACSHLKLRHLNWSICLQKADNFSFLFSICNFVFLYSLIKIALKSSWQWLWLLKVTEDQKPCRSTSARLFHNILDACFPASCWSDQPHSRYWWLEFEIRTFMNNYLHTLNQPTHSNNTYSLLVYKGVTFSAQELRK